MIDEQKSLATISNELTNAEFNQRHKQLARFVKNQLRESKDIANGTFGDYGIIPYTKKKSLLKPGAEKLLKLFGFSASNICIKEVEDFEHKFVLYKYKCTIIHIASGKFIADATRSCNNKEKKHATKDVYDVANTIEGVAQKRALVAATIQATMASEIFDADISENEEEAPERSVTKEEDPRRNRIMSGLYATASEHGWTDEYIHVAIKKKWSVESLTALSNTQIEELKEFIMIKYLPVEKGQKPKLKDEPTKPLIQEGELIDNEDEESYVCKGIKHEGQKEADKPKGPIGFWCSKECQESYYPPREQERTDWTFGQKNEIRETSAAA